MSKRARIGRDSTGWPVRSSAHTFRNHLNFHLGAMRLNGWQRLWVVLSVLWALAVTGLVSAGWETRAAVQHRWAEALRDQRWMLDRASVRTHRHLQFYDALTDTAVIRLVEETAAKVAPEREDDPQAAREFVDGVAALREVMHRELAEIGRRNRTRFGFAVGTVLVLPCLLYAAGATVAWIRHGFSPKRQRVRIIEAEIEDPER
jgi:hypothetical protein